MHIILIILLVLAFAYSLALVVLNNQAIAVNLLFSSVANMSLGLVLVATIFFRHFDWDFACTVIISCFFQNKWEISRLKKKKKHPFKPSLVKPIFNWHNKLKKFAD